MVLTKLPIQTGELSSTLASSSVLLALLSLFAQSVEIIQSQFLILESFFFSACFYFHQDNWLNLKIVNLIQHG